MAVVEQREYVFAARGAAAVDSSVRSIHSAVTGTDAAVARMGSTFAASRGLADQAAMAFGKFGQKVAGSVAQVRAALTPTETALARFTGGVAAMGSQVERAKGGEKLAQQLNEVADSATFARAQLDRYTGSVKEAAVAEQTAADASAKAAQTRRSMSGGQAAGMGLGAVSGPLQGVGSLAMMGGMAASAGQLPMFAAAMAVAEGFKLVGVVIHGAVAATRLLFREVELVTKATIALAAAGTAVAVAFTRAALAAAIERDTTMRGLAAILQSKEAAEAEFKILKDISKLPGINLGVAIKGAVQMRAVGMELTQVNRLMKEFANLNALIGGAPDAIARATLQFAQMAGKGKVTGEELRALANDMPPLLGALRATFGTTSAEDIERMGLSFQHFTERLLVTLEAGPRATSGIRNGLINLKMAWDEALIAFGQPLIGEATIRIFDLLAKAVELLTPYIEKLGITIASYLPAAAKHLEALVTPEGAQALVRRILGIGVEVVSWARSMLASGADLVEGMGSLLGSLLSNFTTFQEALNGVAMATIRSFEAIAAAVIPLLHPLLVVLGKKDLADGLARGLVKTIGATEAFGRVLAQANAVARQAGLDRIGDKITESSARAAAAMRRWSGSAEELAEWHRKATKAAETFTLAQKEQAKAAVEVARHIDLEAQALAELAAAYQAVTLEATRYATQQTAIRASERAAMGALAGRAVGGMYAAGVRAEDPGRATGETVRFHERRRDEDLAKQRSYIDKLKMDQEGATGQRKAALEMAVREGEAKLARITREWDVFLEALREQATNVVETIQEQRKRAEADAKAAQAAWDAASAVNAESRDRERGAAMAAIEEGWKKKGRDIFISNDPARERERTPDLAAAVFGNLGLGDAELIVQAQIDQQKDAREAIIGAGQEAGMSIAETIAHTIANVLPREVALQVGQALGAELEAAR